MLYLLGDLYAAFALDLREERRLAAGEQHQLLDRARGRRRHRVDEDLNVMSYEQLTSHSALSKECQHLQTGLSSMALNR